MVTSPSAQLRWVLLAYRLPREPSTPRIAVWRKLRRLGAVQLLDGLVALPLDGRNREQLEWLAEDVTESGGDATIWIGELASRAQERAVATEMAQTIAEQYVNLAADAADAQNEPPAARRRTLARLRRELQRIRSRDYFPPPERELAHRAVEELGTLIEEPAT